jgi:hypothetical protein
VGAAFALLGVGGLIATLRLGAWVDGDKLYSRTLRGYQPVVRLDRLTDAHLTAFGPNSGRQLRLTDADGARVSLDATNMRIERLYESLARHPGVPASELLQRRMARYRKDVPPRPV